MQHVLLTGGAGSRTVMGVRLGDVVEAITAASAKNRLVAKTGADAIEGANLYSVSFDAAGRPVLTNAAGTLDQNAASLNFVQKITVDLSIGPNLDGSTGGRVEAIQRVSTHPDSDQFLGRILRHEDPAAGIEPPADRSQRLFFDAAAAGLPSLPAQRTSFARDLLTGLVAAAPLTLSGGSDGILADSGAFTGGGSGLGRQLALQAALAARAIAHAASPTAAWVTLSIGVEVARPQEGGRPAALVAAADAALYSAKHRGRNCISAHSGFVSTE